MITHQVGTHLFIFVDLVLFIAIILLFDSSRLGDLSFH